MSDLYKHNQAATPNQYQNQNLLPGCFELSLSGTNARGVLAEDDIVQWVDKKKNSVLFGISKLFILALRQFSHFCGYTDKFLVTGYTTLNCGIQDDSDTLHMFHASEYMNGHPRYDLQ